jgi:hypothetical protein
VYMIQTRKLRASWRLPGCGARADGRTTLHALGSLEARGSLFTDPQTEVYAGMLVRARRRRRPCLVTLQLGVPLARPCSRCWGPPDAAGGAGAARVFTCPREAVQLARLSRQERSNHGKHCLSRRRMMARPARAAVLGKRALWFSRRQTGRVYAVPGKQDGALWFSRRQTGRVYAVPGKQDEGPAPLRRWARWRLWLLR